MFENVFVCVGYLASITCMHGQEGTQGGWVGVCVCHRVHLSVQTKTGGP